MKETPTLILIRETGKKIRSAFDEFFSPEQSDGLGPQDRHLLFYLLDHPGASSADLQSFQGRAKSSISESLRVLVDKDLVQYIVSAEDRREKRVYLTDLGKARCEDAHKRIKEFDSILLSGISSEEEERLRKALEIISSNAERSVDGQE